MNTNDLPSPNTDFYCPILDDPFTETEVFEQIKKTPTNKAASPDGIPPCVLKILPTSWIVLLTFLLNTVFLNSYPTEWCFAKLITIFKKGNKSQCKNYRGISILSCLPKLYDGILNTRFTQWYKPDIEQAGGQTGRGCEEQIMTIRLLIDTARKIGETLYIAFLDYEKAYDKVNRSKLLSMLATRGCGANFLSALTHMLRNTTNIIGSHYSCATAGVKQGSPTSSSLFNFYINDTITRIKQHQPDGFLKELHILLFMDDTVILATSRQTMIDKLNTVYKTSSELDMILHPTKSKYITVNTDDDLPFHIGPVTISYTTNYLYLEAQISNKLMQEQVKLHSQNKQCHVTKFVSFLKNNTDAPFSVKKKFGKARFQVPYSIHARLG